MSESVVSENRGLRLPAEIFGSLAGLGVFLYVFGRIALRTKLSALGISPELWPEQFEYGAVLTPVPVMLMLCLAPAALIFVIAFTIVRILKRFGFSWTSTGGHLLFREPVILLTGLNIFAIYRIEQFLTKDLLFAEPSGLQETFCQVVFPDTRPIERYDLFIAHLFIGLIDVFLLKQCLSLLLRSTNAGRSAQRWVAVGILAITTLSTVYSLAVNYGLAVIPQEYPPAMIQLDDGSGPRSGLLISSSSRGVLLAWLDRKTKRPSVGLYQSKSIEITASSMSLFSFLADTSDEWRTFKNRCRNGGPSRMYSRTTYLIWAGLVLAVVFLGVGRSVSQESATKPTKQNGGTGKEKTSASLKLPGILQSGVSMIAGLYPAMVHMVEGYIKTARGGKRGISTIDPASMNIYILKEPGAAPQRITFDGHYASAVASVGSRQICFIQDGKAGVLDESGKKLRGLDIQHEYAEVLGCNTAMDHYLLLARDGGIYLLHDGERTPLPVNLEESPINTLRQLAASSADLRRLSAGDAGDGKWQIAAVRPGETEPSLVFEDSYTLISPSWFTDGRGVVFLSTRP